MSGLPLKIVNLPFLKFVFPTCVLAPIAHISLLIMSHLVFSSLCVLFTVYLLKLSFLDISTLFFVFLLLLLFYLFLIILVILY